MQLKSSTTLRSGKPIRRPFSSQGRAPASRSGGRPGRPGRLTCDAATPSDGSGLPSSRLTAKERIKQDILGYLEAGKDADDASQAQPREHPPGSGSNGAHGASTGISPSPSGAAEVPQTLEPGSWEWWGAYFSTMDDTVRELDGIYEEMVAAVDEEDYAKAAALREHKARLERMDAVSTVLDDLNTALEEERYSDASTLRDAGGAGFMGWWVGRMESDPYGHLLYISPDFGRYVAHAYSGVNIAELAGFTDEALTSQFGVEAATEPQDNGTAVFEVFVRRDADGMYTQQAAALHAPPGVAMPADILGDLTSLLAAQVGDAGSVSVERGEGEDGVGFVRINIGTPPDESEGGARAQESSADGADEDSDDDISTVDDLLAWMGSEEDGVPTTEIVMEGGQIRSIGAAPVEDEEENEAEGGSGMDQAGEVWMEVDGELRRVGLDEALGE